MDGWAGGGRKSEGRGREGRGEGGAGERHGWRGANEKDIRKKNSGIERQRTFETQARRKKKTLIDKQTEKVQCLVVGGEEGKALAVGVGEGWETTKDS